MEAESLRQHNFTVTYDELLHERYNITPAIQAILQQSYFEVMEHRVGSIKKLKTYIEQYPHIPQFKNQLSVAYRESGNLMLAHEVNKTLINEHPEYLFGMLNEVNQFINEREIEKAATLMEGYNSVQDWDRDRQVFHVSEFSSFEVTLINLLVAQGKIDVAESRLPMLKDADDPYMYQMAKGILDSYKEKQEEITNNIVEGNLGKRWPQIKTPPRLNHPEVKQLYRYDLTIDQALLQNILALPRETVIQDLISLLNDSLVRLEHFLGDEEPMVATWFPFHAISLLAELEAEEAIPVLLDVLRADDEYLEFWWGDAISEEVPQLMVKLLKGNPEPLHQYLKEPNNYLYLRTVAGYTLVWMARKDAGLRNKILEIFKDLFHYFIENQEDESITNPEFVGFLICDAMDLDASGLEPDIKALYENHLVAEWVAGDWESVKKDLKKRPRIVAYDTLSLSERYKNWIEYYNNVSETQNQPNHSEQHWRTSSWDFTIMQEKLAEMDRDGFYDDDDDYYDDDKPEPAVSTKIGRNEPCPCGSGKKYKRCCGA